MKNLETIIMLPLLMLGLLLMMVIDLIRKMKGKPSLMEEWDDMYMDDSMYHGQGRKK